MQLRSRQALIECLEAVGLSERELARAAGLGHATVNHLLTGRRDGCSLGTARAIEQVFEIPAGGLFMPDTAADLAGLAELSLHQAGLRS
jgi:transcriptional regulator with XRE-family HTH domain